jgi:hypothetical protein
MPQEVQLVDVRQIGALLKDAADAIKQLADAIAHIIQLGDSAWSEIAARKTRRRLINIYRTAGVVAQTQVYAIDMLDYILGGNYISWSRWPDLLSRLEQLTEHVEDTLAALKAERSDFVIENAHWALFGAMHGRAQLFARLRMAELPTDSERLGALVALMNEWKLLHIETIRALEAMQILLKAPTPFREEIPPVAEKAVDRETGPVETSHKS